MVVERDRKHHADVKCEKHHFPRTLPIIFDRLSRHLGFSNLARLISRVSNLGLLYLWFEPVIRNPDDKESKYFQLFFGSMWIIQDGKSPIRSDAYIFLSENRPYKWYVSHPHVTTADSFHVWCWYL